MRVVMCWGQGIHVDRHRVLNSKTDAPCCFQSEMEETRPAGIVAAPVADPCGIGLTLPVPRTEEPTALDTSAEGHGVASRPVGVEIERAPLVSTDPLAVLPSIGSTRDSIRGY